MVNIITLVENTTSSPVLHSKHGLCLYIETEKHKILFDLGPDDTFAKNAKKLGIDIGQIDTVIISHGHKDHGGGLRTFLSANTKAKIYITRSAFDPHHIKVLHIPIPVGLDQALVDHEQIVFSDGQMRIDDELQVFSGVQRHSLQTKSNDVLFMTKDGRSIPDDFSHEQSLIITADDKNILISGCSHAGIVDIQNQAESIMSEKMAIVIGGFHLYNPPTKKYESDETITSIANALVKNTSTYYTCHCTGPKAYQKMGQILGDRLHYLSTGSTLSV